MRRIEARGGQRRKVLVLSMIEMRRPWLVAGWYLQIVEYCRSASLNQFALRCFLQVDTEFGDTLTFENLTPARKNP